MRLEVIILVLNLTAFSGAENLSDINRISNKLEEKLSDKINNWFKTPEDHANYLNNITRYPVSCYI